MPLINLDIIRKYFASQPVKKAWLFGSYARGEQTDDSDVDLLVTFDDNARMSLFTFAGMMIDLENLINKPVDLVPYDSVYPRIKPYIDQDKILIYERVS